ncbi:hypothetical protein MTR67_017200 [Solanum verrucosum]|uniref:Uncharacterized protein n=1 Tax=Solanum verrucosum TaxID=315347 RepID=A0AAF0TS12_SOLVR|nr:hypothetical protein MTR67_017200 [Solanum verrucosum]
MTTNSSGLENNQTGKWNAQKRSTFSNILNHIVVSTRNSISHSSKLGPVKRLAVDATLRAAGHIRSYKEQNMSKKLRRFM